ncbi:MBL fold metallo-hydrolase [Candidatus Bipolaricaulota bacterium]|nr:MBL fold metallo-hydrolase [Candidatus Bipolaricaulota bacterium]
MRSAGLMVAGLFMVGIGVVGLGNLPPQLAEIGPLVVEEGRSFPSLVISEMVSDPDHADSELAWSFEEHEKLCVTMAGGRINIRARDPDWSGTTTLLFRVCDPDGACAERQVQFTITPVNDAPVLSLPDLVLRAGESFPKVNLAQYVHDPDHALDQLSWEVTGDSELAITIDRGVASIAAPDDEWQGIEMVQFSVCDPEGACAEQTVMIARSPATVSVTLVGNAGYIIDDGRTTIAVDALLAYGVAPDVQQRMALGEAPFAGIDLILVTHEHADQFLAECVVGQMNVDPGSIVIAPSDVTRQIHEFAPEIASDRLISVELEPNGSYEIAVAGITLEVMDFPHSPTRSPRNVGFLIKLAEATLFHPGDIVVEALGSEMEQHAAAGRAVDIAFLPHFNVTDARYAPFVETIDAAYIVPIHAGALELEGVCRQTSRCYDNALCFFFPLQQRIIPVF